MVRKDDIKQMDSIVRKLGLTQDQREFLHRAIRGENLTYREILEVARQLKQEYPRK